MDRNFWMVSALVCAPFVALFGFNMWNDPLTPQRDWLSSQLAGIALEQRAEVVEETPKAAWLESIAAKPVAWRSITTPPPAPAPEAPPPPPPPKCPDMKEMLAGIRIPARAQIGNRIRVIHPDSPRGDWMTRGAVLKGCVLADFDKTSVTFTFECKEAGKMLTLKIPRE